MRHFVFGCLGLIVWGGVTGCGRKPTEPGQIPGAAATGMLRVLLGSEPATGQVDPGVEEVWVRVDGVEARHQSEGWVTVTNERQDLDLLGGAGPDDVQDGGMGGHGGPYAVSGAVDEGGGVQDLSPAYEVLGEGRVWTGGYDRLHLGITDAWLVVDGAQQDLGFIGDVDPLDPFDRGLTIREPFYVDEGATTTVNVSWNVGENLTRKDDGSYSLGARTTLEVDIEE